MRRPLVALLAITAVSGLITAGLMGVDAHPGHVQKTLFTGRWYNASTMDLSTSQINNANLLLCDGNFNLCSPKWAGPITGAVNQWNAQQDTADFVVQPDYNLNYDINIWVIDNISAVQPGILGMAFFYNSTGAECDPDACGATNTYYYGDAVMGDDWHFGDYGGATARQTTVLHELGHLLSLCHESVTGSCQSSEGAHLQCGTDDSGPVPTSVMAYDCIQPPSVGGSGVTTIQPFDVCGVNHAYPDATFGFAGCPATPTPSPSPIPAGANAFGNVDCGGGISSVDSLKVLRKGAGLTYSQTEPCPDIADEMHASGWPQGDVDCSTAVNSVDSLKLLRFNSGLSVAQAPGCPTIGS
jgi:hypothetical protein